MGRTINIGIAGSAGRGSSFKLACEASGILKIHAVCDTNEQALEESRERLGAVEAYVSYDEMLEKSDIEAVIIGTPMHFHVPQAIAALKKDKHVLSEVPAGISLEECRELVDACRKTGAVYMMAENYTYIRSNVIMRELVGQGLFGQVYFGEAEYIHELKGLNEQTKWRRKWQTGINGITYPTHSIGPLLQWMPGDRVQSLTCAGSGHHYRDPRGDIYENEDSCVMLCKMVSGGLIKIRVDMLSDRPHAMTNYQLQGTDGSYESSRAHGDPDRIWLRSLGIDVNQWVGLETLAEKYLPPDWKAQMEIASKAGHGGGDYFEVIDFVDSILGRKPCPIGIHEAMDMTLPGLVSQQSIMQGSEWLEVPDSRKW